MEKKKREELAEQNWHGLSGVTKEEREGSYWRWGWAAQEDRPVAGKVKPTGKRGGRGVT